MQAVEEGDQIEILLRIAFGRPNLETSIRSNAVFPGMGCGLLDRARMKVIADELRLGEGLSISTVDQPWPHPTSATLAPRCNLSTTPSSAGSQVLIKLFW